MASVNLVCLLGNLGKDPEFRTFDSGQSVANFSLATSEMIGAGEERKEKTEWHKIVTWGKTAEQCKTYLKKGSQVFLEGRLQTREWDDKSGAKQRTTEIVASRVVFLGGSNKSGNVKSSDNNESVMVSTEDGSLTNKPEAESLF